MARKIDPISVAKRDVREIREILKMLRKAPTANYGGPEKWVKVVESYEVSLKKANALVKTLTK